MLGFLKKRVGLKIAVAASAGTVAFALTALVAIGNLRLDDSPQSLVAAFALFSLFFVFFQFAFTALAVNAFIGKPLALLHEGMRKVGEGNLTATCAPDSGDEFGETAESFNTMIRGLSEMNETRKRIEQRLIKTEESLKYKMALEDKSKIIERMNAELTDAFNNVALLYAVSQYLNSVLDMKELVANVQKIFEEKFKCDQYALYFVSPVEDELQLACCKGFRNQHRWDEHRVRLGVGIAGKVAESNRTLYLESADPAFDMEIEPTDLEKRMRGSIHSAPLHVRGSLIGVLTVVRADKNAFTPTDRQSLQSISSQIAVAYDRCKLYTRTKELAVRDELTGAYNRRHFQQMLELELKRAERYKRHVTLLMIDVDHFKKFNDTYGHLKGDELLKKLTKLLKKNLREMDVLARYGGEEFVVMLTDTSMNDGINVASKLRELVKMNLKVTGHPQIAAGPSPEAQDGVPASVTISIGVSSYPECANTPEELLNSADMALYVAKHKGRDRVHAYQVGNLPLEELMSKMGFIH
jgi:diguanylate cyclase (GGDEF)-like protein